MAYTELTFSIIIPSYNRKDFLAKTINSVLSQNYFDFEIILIDDGSVDGTEEFVRSEYPQIWYVKQTNQERGAARNKGASLARGQYLYFLDSDDLVYPDHLKKAVEFLKEQKEPPSWFFQEYEILQADGTKKAIEYNRAKPIESLLKSGNFLSCHGVFVRRDIFSEYQFSEDRNLAGSEDYELWVRLAAQYSLVINPVVTSALVQHEERSVYNFSLEKLIQRKEKMLSSLLENPLVQKRFSEHFDFLRSHTYSYIALHAAMIGKKKSSLYYWRKAIAASPSSMMQKRNLAILKHLLLH
jgi:glycosyltransferase involved in cell wall biosynthesis